MKKQIPVSESESNFLWLVKKKIKKEKQPPPLFLKVMVLEIEPCDARQMLCYELSGIGLGCCVYFNYLRVSIHSSGLPQILNLPACFLSIETVGITPDFNKRSLWDWRAVKSTGFPCRELDFSSQNPHVGSNPFVTPVWKTPTPSSDLHVYQTHKWHTYIHGRQTLICIR